MHHKKGRPLSAVSQHRTYYLSQQQTDHPHKIFWNELTKQLIKWKDNREQLILGGNWNADLPPQDKTIAKPTQFKRTTQRTPSKSTLY